MIDNIQLLLILHKHIGNYEPVGCLKSECLELLVIFFL